MNSSTSRRTFINTCSKISSIALVHPWRFFNLNKKNSEWRAEASLPYQLQEIYCAVLDSQIHVAGGFISQDGILGVSDHHIVFYPKENRWEEKAALPAPRHHPQLVSCNDQLYVFGGYTAESGQNSWIAHKQTWQYNTAENKWIELPSAPRYNGETVAATVDNRIHIVGGRHPAGNQNLTYRDKEDVNTHMVFDPASESWELAAPALTKRNSAAGAVIEGLLYIAGGRNMNTGNVNDLEIYDYKDDRWRNGSPMPQGQGGCAAAALNGKLYVFGGEYFDNGSGVYKECWCYDPKKDKWTSSIPMRTPRHGLCGATFGNRIYAIGGAKKASAQETSNAVESITF